MAVRKIAEPEIQPDSFAFTPENDAWADRQIAKYPPDRQASAVIALLTRAQQQAGGWVPQKAIEAVAAKLDMPYIRVMEVATFYSMFNLEPVGRHLVQLCGTTPCALRGANDLKAVLQRRMGDQNHVTPDGTFSWVEVECLGACANAPMVQINDDYFEDLTPEILDRLLDDLAAGREVKPGPQNGRTSSEPLGEVKTLTDPSLFDGSQIGAWRKRFEEETPKEAAAEKRAEAEAVTTQASVATAPKPARPDAGWATEGTAANAPAQRAAEGELASTSKERQAAAYPSDTGAPLTPAVHTAPIAPPESDKSYVATPVDPKEGRPVADAPATAPDAATPVSDTGKRRTGRASKPVGPKTGEASKAKNSSDER